MTYKLLAATLTACALNPAAILHAAGMDIKPLAVGSNLQASATIKLTEPAPEEGLQIKLTSNDASRLRISRSPDSVASESIMVAVRGGFDESAEFWVHALAGSGDASYTATAPGLTTAKGAVTFTPSAIAILGPLRAPKFQTTLRADPVTILFNTVRLDSSLHFVEAQAVRSGLTVKFNVTSSNPEAGTIAPTTLTIAPGGSSAVTEFQALAHGSANLAVTPPPGFTAPADYGSVTAIVRVPGIFITTDVVVGENLQVAGLAGLGEAAPAGGAKVTIVSDDPERLLLSPSATQVGSKSITLTIPEGQSSMPYFLQALRRTGTVTCSASAPGYLSREAKIGLAPSGLVIRPTPLGPPDEAALLRKEAAAEQAGFVSHLSKRTIAPLSVWTAQLDPVTLRSADITVQPLRAGVDLKIAVEIANPAIGTVDSPITIPGGEEVGSASFTPAAVGSTIVSVVTPEGFTKSANSTTVKIVVKE